MYRGALAILSYLFQAKRVIEGNLKVHFHEGSTSLMRQSFQKSFLNEVSTSYFCGEMLTSSPMLATIINVNRSKYLSKEQHWY